MKGFTVIELIIATILGITATVEVVLFLILLIDR
jgi:hypothetical protein